MDELILLLNERVRVVADFDPLLELHLYVLKQAMAGQPPDPNFEVVLLHIEATAAKQSQALQRMWISHNEAAAELLISMVKERPCGRGVTYFWWP